MDNDTTRDMAIQTAAQVQAHVADCFQVRIRNEAKLDKIDEKRIEVHFKAGELIFKQGTPNLHFLCLTQGMVKLYIEGFDNKNLIIGLVKPVEYILGPGIYVDNKHHYFLIGLWY